MPDRSYSIGNWATYIPTWESSGTAPALGNGSISGRYVLLGGGTVHGTIVLTMGSTTTFGTGIYLLGAPTGLPMTFPGHGVGSVFDSSATAFNAIVGRYDNSARFALLTTANPSSFVGPSTPITFAQSDQIQLDFTYRVAV